MKEKLRVKFNQPLFNALLNKQINFLAFRPTLCHQMSRNNPPVSDFSQQLNFSFYLYKNE